jgi:hypothetical protein
MELDTARQASGNAVDDLQDRQEELYGVPPAFVRQSLSLSRVNVAKVV